MAINRPRVRRAWERVGRREVLVWSATALLEAACEPLANPRHATSARALRSPSRASAPPRIVIIGGGLTGLAAAHALRKMGAAVTVLEAQGRVGGRILTVRSPFHQGLYVEAGAAHVVGDPALLALCDELNEKGRRYVGGHCAVVTSSPVRAAVMTASWAIA